MNELGRRIRALIAAQGPLPIAHYMTLALHDPQGGYYATQDPFGQKGDFVTAPEISQMFGELLGLWCVQAWRDQGRPKKARLVELGPGRGTLMADALRAAKLMPQFAESIEIVLIEASPILQVIQKKALKDRAVRWVSHFDRSLGDRPLFLIANEFFDALPIHQYVKTARGWCERMVTADGDGLSFALAPLASPAAAMGREDAPEGGVHEKSPAATALAEEIAVAIARAGGAALILDYGYANDGGFGETLQAVRRHRFVDVLDEPGASDISAHVDFAALADAARRGGATAYGPAPQGEFLNRLGLGERARALARANPAEADSIAAAARRLAGPGEMGRLFKALAIMPMGTPTPPGFQDGEF